MGHRQRWPARPRPTPRGIVGKRVTLYVDQIVRRFVPEDRLAACIDRYRSGVRTRVEGFGMRPVWRLSCIHDGFEYWLVDFPDQRRTFIGPPEMFAPYFPSKGVAR